MLQDFIGFRFNGVHSSDLKIYRVSNGSRYEETLGPAFQDKTEQVVGGDNTLYWNTFYSSKTWNIQIAFDDLSEAGIRRLRQVFDAKKVGELVFDELPFKAYSVKIQSPVQLKYICFGDKGARIYKGEGTIQFISYSPYARSVSKYLDLYGAAYNNKKEWAETSGMKDTQGDYDVVGESNEVKVFNAGDVPTDWIADYELVNFEALGTFEVKIDGIGILILKNIVEKKKENDVYLSISSRTHLIEGRDENKEPTGSLYNEFLTEGDFFKIPLGDSIFKSSVACQALQYDYLYY